MVKSYPLSLLSVKAGDIHRLLKELSEYPGSHSVHAFGQCAHLAFQPGTVKTEALSGYLHDKKHDNVEILQIEPNIEDCFMELMRGG